MASRLLSALSLEPFDKPQVDLVSTEEAVQESDTKQETELKVDETDELLALSKPKDRKPITFLGSMLFSRVVPVHTTKTVAGHTFDGYMSHVDEYVPHGATGAVPYLTAAAAIGVTREEIDVFAERLERTVREFLEKERR
ncbi:hypothetical protein BC937DRAFT_88287 [Endogone sp. FLAS-F59071]|nr:hypothetical protein BC937DRAFT_88287 [Endogone sp. FLAS-F59071]|eukprot:RUS18839.1 hypothetical protein BC937DRAFT_88287 [Endogone sp. FLAS-F59071]